MIPSASTMLRQNSPQAGNAPVSGPAGVDATAAACGRSGGGAEAKAAAKTGTASARAQSLIPAVHVSVSARTVPRRMSPMISSAATGPCCWPESST